MIALVWLLLCALPSTFCIQECSYYIEFSGYLDPVYFPGLYMVSVQIYGYKDAHRLKQTNQGVIDDNDDQGLKKFQTGINAEWVNEELDMNNTNSDGEIPIEVKLMSAHVKQRDQFERNIQYIFNGLQFPLKDKQHQDLAGGKQESLHAKQQQMEDKVHHHQFGLHGNRILYNHKESAGLDVKCMIPAGLVMHIKKLIHYTNPQISHVFFKVDNGTRPLPPNTEDISRAVDGHIDLLTVKGGRFSWSDILSMSDIFNITRYLNIHEVNFLLEGENSQDKPSMTRALYLNYNIECESKNYDENIKDFQWQMPTCPLFNDSEVFKSEYLTKIPQGKFPGLREFIVKNIDLGSVQGSLNLTNLGEVSSFIIGNNNLKEFPIVKFKPGRFARHAKSKYDNADDNFFRSRDETAAHKNMYRKLYDSNLWRIQDKYYTNILSLEHNAIQSVPKFPYLDSVDELILNYNNIGSGEANTLHNARNIYNLEIIGNPIRELPVDFFVGIRKLEFLYIEMCQLHDIDKVDWKRADNLRLISLRHNNISSIDQLLLRSPELRAISAEVNDIKSLPMLDKDIKTKFEYIWLTQNQFRTFPVEVFSMRSLKSIDLTMNPIDTEGLEEMLNVESIRNEYLSIWLMENCVEFFPLASPGNVDKLNRILQKVTILMMGNPLHCGCDEFIAWLKRMGIQEAEKRIFCDFEKAKLNKPNFDYHYKEFRPPTCIHKSTGYPYRCQADLHRERVLLLSMIMAVFSMTCLGTVYGLWRYSRHIQAYVYLSTGVRLGCCSRRRDAAGKYDAFVTYCGRGETRWVVKKLLQRLEKHTEPGYKLCIPDRDLVAGRNMIADTVGNMENSSRCIALISRTSIHDDWGSFQLYSAIWEAAVRRNRNYVIPIIYHDVTYDVIPSRLRHALRRVPLLYMNDQFFWKKLEFALKSSRVEIEAESTEESRLLIDEVSV